MEEHKPQKMKALEQVFSEANDKAHRQAFKIRNEYHHYIPPRLLEINRKELTSLAEKMIILGEEYFNIQLNSGIAPETHPNYEKFFEYIPAVPDALDRESALRELDNENDSWEEQDFLED